MTYTLEVFQAPKEGPMDILKTSMRPILRGKLTLNQLAFENRCIVRGIMVTDHAIGSVMLLGFSLR